MNAKASLVIGVALLMAFLAARALTATSQVPVVRIAELEIDPAQREGYTIQ
jgi:hypothetical protein